MKTITKFMCLCMLLFATTLSYSQNYTDTNSVFDSFKSANAENNFLSSQTYQVQQTGGTDNSIFISQTGRNNEISSTTSSESSDLKYFQRGDNNDIYVNLNADRIEETVLQNGNNNSVLNFNSLQLKYHQGQIIQNGNNQNLTWYGGNSISEKLKITMEGNSQSVIVRNFN